MPLELWLLEDSAREQWTPFAETRPMGEILFGNRLLRERLEGWLGIAADRYLVPSRIDGFEEEGAPATARELPDPQPEGSGRARLLITPRFAPEGSSGPPVELARWLSEAPDEGRVDGPPRPIPLVVEVGDDAPRGVGWLVPPGAPWPASEGGTELPGASDVGNAHGRHPEPIRVRGRLYDDPWTLMAANPGQIARDLGLGGDGAETREIVGADLPAHAVRLGSHRVTGDEGVRIDPHVVLDAREGPIHLSRNVRLAPFTHLAGPAWIGADTQLLGGRIAGVSIGPVCKIRGEVETSIILGCANKAHDGYLGHSIAGRWVNLGAGTTNSDLKNNYSPVRVKVSGNREVSTGLLKVGVFLGDHVKTGIGTILNTGTVVGAGSNLFGGMMPDTWIPPFSWGSGDRLVPYRLDRFLEVADRAMARRDRSLAPGMERMLTTLWELTHGQVVS